jgi:hypothetical protein
MTLCYSRAQAGLALLQQRGGLPSLAALFEAQEVAIKAGRDEKPIGPEGACARRCKSPGPACLCARSFLATGL